MLGAIGLILGLMMAMGVGYFSLLNQTSVTVHFWPGMPPRSAFIWEIAGYAALVGWLSSSVCWFVPWWNAKQRARQLRRRVRELEARLPSPQPVVGEAPRTALENGQVGVTTGISRAVVQPDEEPV